jgi:hypothetical protein
VRLARYREICQVNGSCGLPVHLERPTVLSGEHGKAAQL